MSFQRSQGFTLIELLVTVALIAITAAFVVPSFSEIIANSRISSTTNAFVGALNHARAEAVKRGVRVEVSPLASAGSSNEWGGGWRVWVDEGTAGYQAGEEIRLFDSVPGSVTIDGDDSVSSFRFRPNGFVEPEPSGSLEYSFEICDDRTGETGRNVSIGVSGRIRQENHTCG